jgi:hypothetical protein
MENISEDIPLAFATRVGFEPVKENGFSVYFSDIITAACMVIGLTVGIAVPKYKY